jgi:hypothetical protein
LASVMVGFERELFLPEFSLEATFCVGLSGIAAFTTGSIVTRLDPLFPTFDVFS